MADTTVLTGITTTGTPHLGNYVGAIRPGIEASRRTDAQCYYFLADLHGIIKCWEPDRLRQSTLEIAASWLALGLDTSRAIFYRQSDVPEITQLTWILTCVTAKGLMNRAHAYKAVVQANEEDPERDPDQGITMGLFSYPVLMAADILLFNATHVPVGKDQGQHLEMTRDIGARFNHLFGEHFVLPAAVIDEDAAVLPGTDGRKMSKSYDNTIPLWLPSKKLRKAVMKIKTNSLEPGEPKDPNDSALYDIYRAVAGEAAGAELAQALRDGIAWGEAKQQVFERIDAELAEPRERYESLIANPGQVEAELQAGAERARAYARPFLRKVRASMGMEAL